MPSLESKGARVLLSAADLHTVELCAQASQYELFSKKMNETASRHGSSITLVVLKERAPI